MLIGEHLHGLDTIDGQHIQLIFALSAKYALRLARAMNATFLEGALTFALPRGFKLPFREDCIRRAALEGVTTGNLSSSIRSSRALGRRELGFASLLCGICCILGLSNLLSCQLSRSECLRRNLPPSKPLILRELLLCTRLVRAILGSLKFLRVFLLRHDHLEASVRAVQIVVNSVDEFLLRVNLLGNRGWQNRCHTVFRSCCFFDAL